MNQVYGNNFGGINSTQSGNITTNTSLIKSDLKDFEGLIDELKVLIEQERDSLNAEKMADVIDDIDVLSEEIHKPKQNDRRMKKAINNIKIFISEIPQALKTGTEIITIGQKIYDFIDKIIPR